ncbi:hypothetical protein EON67_10870, partial [archaeon]
MEAKDLAKPKYTGITQTIWLVSKEEGPRALWKGNGASARHEPRSARSSKPRTAPRTAPPPREYAHRVHVVLQVR